jgi:hypothetical protein
MTFLLRVANRPKFDRFNITAPEWSGADLLTLFLFLEILTMNTINKYEIGGIIASMTSEQAERWNRGDWTDEDDLTATVILPDEIEQGSSLRNGEVVLHSPVIVKFCEAITMKEAFGRGLHDEYMDGMPANLLRRNV